MYNSKKYKAMADKSAEKERLFNEWFTKSYDRLRGYAGTECWTRTISMTPTFL